jgi:hypothetical protein
MAELLVDAKLVTDRARGAGADRSTTLSTARKHGRNPLDVLGQLFQGQAWLPPLGPLPAPPCPGAA